MNISIPLYRLSSYLQKQDCNNSAEPVPYSLLVNLPSPYEATKVFGLELLNIHGFNSKPIRSLFCIRTYALEYGINKAIELFYNKTITEYETEMNLFPKKYFECCNILPKQLVGLAADLEKIRLCYELSHDIAVYRDSILPNYETQKYRNICTFRYLQHMCWIMELLETLEFKEEAEKFYTFGMKQFEYMLLNSTIRKYHIRVFNLENRLKYNEIKTLKEVTKKITYLQ
jgi:hypothetical protein